jgi:hypothetical protein
MAEIYRSSYLRALAWAAESRMVEPFWIEAYTIETSPI